MADRLWTIANATGIDAKFTSTNGDTGVLVATAVTHTGGKDGNFIYVPHCSESKYYPAHHILITFPKFKIALWANDDQNLKMYYSDGDYYTEGHPINGTENYVTFSIFLKLNAAGTGAEVHCFPF